MASEATVRCAMCHLLTTVEEAMSRTFHQGKCGSCGGDLILHILDTMPDALVTAPMKANGEIHIPIQEVPTAAPPKDINPPEQPPLTETEAHSVGMAIPEPEAPKSKRRRS